MFEFLPDVDPVQFDRMRGQFDRWVPLVREIALLSGCDSTNLKPFSEGSNIVFSSGSDRVIKIFPHFLNHQFEAERAALPIVQGRLPVKTPRLIRSDVHGGWSFIVMDFLPGETLSAKWSELSFENKSTILSQLGQLISAHHQIAVDPASVPSPTWDEFIKSQAEKCLGRHLKLGIPSRLSSEIPTYLARNLHLIPLSLSRSVLLTGEFTPGNILVERQNDQWVICALIDYADSMIGHPEYDLLGPGTFLASGNAALLRNLFEGYGYQEKDMKGELAERLMTLLLLHRYSNLDIQLRGINWTGAQSIDGLQNLVWPMS